MKRWIQTGLVATVVTTMFSGLIGGSADVSARGTQETYESPTYGVTLEYDAAVWSIFQENDGSDGRGVDFLGLESDQIRGGLMIQTYDTQTDADDCLASLVDLGLEKAEDPELREDDDGEPMEGSSRGYAYAAYSFLSEGVYVSSYFGCQEIGGDVGMIAFWLMVNARDFDVGLELTEPIIESVDDSDAHAAGEGDDNRDGEDDEDNDREDDKDDLDRDDKDEDEDRDEDEDDRDREEDDQDDVADQLADSGVYESPKFGFTVPINIENWELGEITADDNHESATFTGPDREILDIMTFQHYGERLNEYPDYYVQSLERQGDVEIELYEDPATGDTIDRTRRGEVYGLYMFEADGDDYLLYLHAVVSDDSRYVVMVVGISLVSSYGLLEEDLFKLLDQIEF